VSDRVGLPDQKRPGRVVSRVKVLDPVLYLTGLLLS